MSIEQAIIDRVRILPPEKQEEILAFIDLVAQDEWDKTYKGKFKKLQQIVQVGIDAAERGEVIEGDVMFQQLRERLKQQAQMGQ